MAVMDAASRPLRPRSDLAARLVRSRVRMVVNTAFKQGRKRRGRNSVIAVLIVAGMVGSFQIAGAIFGFVNPGSSGLTAVVAGALGMLVGFTAVTSITFALSSLYFAKDLDLLHSAPLRPRIVILSRIQTQLGLGVALGVVIAGPPLLAYLIAVHQLLALPLVALTVIALVTLPLSLGTALTVLSLRAVPARLVRDASGLVVTAAVFLVAAINLAIRGPAGFSGKPGALPFNQIGAGPIGAQWSPVGWAARAVAGAVRGDLGTWARWSLPLVAAAVILPALVARVCEGAYLTGYQRSAQVARRPHSTDRGRRSRRSLRNRPVWMVIAGKDLREVRRDPSQMGQLLLPMVLFALYLGTPGHSAPGAAGGLPAWFLIALNACFASLLFAANIALRGVGVEGQRIWILRIAPVRGIDVLAAKYVAGFVIAALPACLLFWIGEIRDGVALIDMAIPTVGVCVMIGGVVALAIGLGASRPRLDWTDPRRAVSIGVTLIYLALGATYLASCFIVLGFPFAASGGSAASVAIADLVLVVLTGGVAAAALRIGSNHLNRLEV